MQDAVALMPLMSFDEACEVVLQHLKSTVPLGFWSVSQHVDGRQVYLAVKDDAYGRQVGGSHAWSDSFCQYMVAGETPQIAPDAMAVPQYAAAGVARALPIGAYVGIPIRGGDGELFGTLCGMDPVVQQPALAGQAPALHLLATLLGQILAAERLREEAVQREAELQHRAFHDQLTGLPNRAKFLDRAGHAVALHRRDLRPVAALLIDLDDFKAVNDTLGHASGDLLLVRVGERLRGVLRPGDTLARLGGDEFAVLLEDGGDAAVVAQRVVDAVEQPFDLCGTRIAVGASVGVAELPADAGTLDVDALLARADTAMYVAKRGGKNRVSLYDPVTALPAAQDLRLREPLRHAIAAGAVEAHFQPVVDLASGEVLGYEALARWTLDGAPVPPDVFIPIAARAGLLPALTAHMLDVVGGQLHAWLGERGHRLVAGVNVSPDLISDPDFPRVVADCVERHGLAPGQLVLEITEEALLSDLPRAREVADELCRIGATLWLDDFGTGYSSLLHLQQIPLAAVKIDRGFTADLDTNPATERLMRALLALGRDLGLMVIVEGVERPAQAKVLRRLGCRFAQGYHFARPTPADDVLHAPAARSATAT